MRRTMLRVVFVAVMFAMMMILVADPVAATRPRMRPANRNRRQPPPPVLVQGQPAIIVSAQGVRRFLSTVLVGGDINVTNTNVDVVDNINVDGVDDINVDVDLTAQHDQPHQHVLLHFSPRLAPDQHVFQPLAASTQRSHATSAAHAATAAIDVFLRSHRSVAAHALRPSHIVLAEARNRVGDAAARPVAIARFVLPRRATGLAPSAPPLTLRQTRSSRLNLRTVHRALALLDAIAAGGWSVASSLDCIAAVSDDRRLFPSSVDALLLATPRCLVAAPYSPETLANHKRDLRALLPTFKPPTTLDSRPDVRFPQFPVDRQDDDRRSYFARWNGWYAVDFTSHDFISYSRANYESRIAKLTTFRSVDHIRNFATIFIMMDKLRQIGVLFAPQHMRHIRQIDVTPKAIFRHADNNNRAYSFAFPISSQHFIYVSDNNTVEYNNTTVNAQYVERLALFELAKMYLEYRKLLPCAAFLDAELRDMDDKFIPSRSSVLQHVAQAVGVESHEYDFISRLIVGNTSFSDLASHPLFTSTDPIIPDVYGRGLIPVVRYKEISCTVYPLWKSVAEASIDGILEEYEFVDSLSIFNLEYAVLLITKLRSVIGNSAGFRMTTSSIGSTEHSQGILRPLLMVAVHPSHGRLNENFMWDLVLTINTYNKAGLAYLPSDFVAPDYSAISTTVLVDGFEYPYKSVEFERSFKQPLDWAYGFKDEMKMQCNEFSNDDIWLPISQTEQNNTFGSDDIMSVSVSDMYEQPHVRRPRSKRFKNRVKRKSVIRTPPTDFSPERNYKFKLSSKTDSCLLGAMMLRALYSLHRTRIRDVSIFEFRSAAVPTEYESKLLDESLFVADPDQRISIMKIFAHNGKKAYRSVKHLLDLIQRAYNNVQTQSYNVITNPNPSEDDTCSICYLQLEEEVAAMRSCSHIFHEDCLKEWHRIKDNCPMCRSSYTGGGRIEIPLPFELYDSTY